ncbi:MAG: acyl-CoA dehydrogenase family protein [Actinomycetota bacterium]
MDLRYSDSDEAFRAELRAWLADALPLLPPKPGADDWQARRAWDTRWQRMLFEAGYAGIDWPREVEGRGASPTEHLIFLEETERAGAPYVGVNFVGLLHAGPTLIAEGTPEQKQQHLPRILRGEEVWCQGFSEPGAGSDLAALATKAVLDGDHYVVSDQKIWTSFAHVADFCELLVRTDTPKHKGITWLIMPMDAKGIEIQPLRTITGSTEFSQMFLDEVRIPVANRVGNENDGWRVAMVTFSFERGTAFVGELIRTMSLVEDVAALAKRTPRDGGTAWDDDGLRRDLGKIAAELDALWALTRRNVTQSEHGTGVPGLGGSVFKLAYSEVRARLGDLTMKLLGGAALALEDVGGIPSGIHVERWFQSMSLTIAAGTSQIQRNIVGERILGLPKEPA